MGLKQIQYPGGDDWNGAIVKSEVKHLFGGRYIPGISRQQRPEHAGRFGNEHDYQEIDHIEIFSKSETADSRNFVLCPGIEYDRSPCGTGTSAKLACLYEDGKLKEGEIWRQESIIGSVFEGKVTIINGDIIPQIRGNAFITADNELILDENDPFRFGI